MQEIGSYITSNILPSQKAYQIIVADAADAVSVNFSGRCNFFFRFNAKIWQFTVYFAVITQKIDNLLCILS